MAELFCFIILSCEKESDYEDILFQLLLLCFCLSFFPGTQDNNGRIHVYFSLL